MPIQAEAAGDYEEVIVQRSEMSRNDGKLCQLQSAVDRIEECPRGGCPFWEPGTQVLEPGCAIERLGLPLELDRNPQLAYWLLFVRAGLDERREREERGRLGMQLPPGLHE